MISGGRSTDSLRDWRVDPGRITTVGANLSRPECVLAEHDGTLWAADARGGVMRIATDGSQELIGRSAVVPGVEAGDEATFNDGDNMANGLALLPDGDLLVANIGRGVLERISREGVITTICSDINGEQMGMVNFVLVDSHQRVWLTVTTRLEPWSRGVNDRIADGYIALVSDGRASIVADGFVGTNEIRFDAAEEWLYVVESHARRITRIRVRANGSLGERETYGPSDLGGIPDGMAFDREENLWITLVNADRLIALTPSGEIRTLLDDGDHAAVERFERHFAARTTTPEIMSAARGTVAPMMSSITFGGDDLRSVYLGSLMGTEIATFRSPVEGLALSHW